MNINITLHNGSARVSLWNTIHTPDRSSPDWLCCQRSFLSRIIYQGAHPVIYPQGIWVCVSVRADFACDNYKYIETIVFNCTISGSGLSQFLICANWCSSHCV
jgi:hypothetical protein